MRKRSRTTFVIATLLCSLSVRGWLLAVSDDCQAVSYFYQARSPATPQGHSPTKWKVIGPFADGNSLEAFNKPADELVRQLSQAELSGRVRIGETDYDVHDLDSQYG
ncbi:MAG: hypothetical protein ACKV2Q_31140 [Planctomycetaceae bacterium]